MALNKGVLRANRTESGDECYTPFYAVEPLLPYLPRDKTIWCPFDLEWSAFCQRLKEEGFQVVRSSIQEGQDFFTYEPEHWDLAVSNPPFSKKDQVLERLYGLGKPFAMLLPLASLQGIRRFSCFQQGVQLLAFDRRIAFHKPEQLKTYAAGCSFASAYFCKDVLPDSLILKPVKEYHRPLIETEE